MPTIKTSSGNIRFKTKTIFWGVKLINKEISAENLSIVKHILDKFNVKFMLFSGTLLGAVREKDFITHDEDVDLAFLDEDKQKALDSLPELISAGFSIARYDERGLLSIIRKDEYIDFYFFKPQKGEEVLRTCCGWIIPDKFLTNYTKIEFKGEIYDAPQDYIGFLIHEYGNDWMTPIKWFNYEVSWWKIKLLTLKEYLKDILPNFIKEKLQIKAEKKLETLSRERLKRFIANGGTLT